MEKLTPATTLSDINQIPDALMAQILNMVVEYKRQHEGLTHVVKASGKIVDDPTIRRRFAEQVVSMRRDLGLKVVVVHGAGKQITRAIKDETGEDSEFENDLRITRSHHVEIVDRVTRQTNRVLCDMFGDASAGHVLPIGLSGYDPELDMVSEPIDADKNNFSGNSVLSFNPWRLMRHLNDEKSIPIITNMCGVARPIGNVSKINVNADPVASKIAMSLKAHRLLMCGREAGVLDENGHVIPELRESDVQGLLDRKVIDKGMAVKVRSAFDTARNMGAGGGVVIMDENFLMELLTKKGHGTMCRIATP